MRKIKKLLYFSQTASSGSLSLINSGDQITLSTRLSLTYMQSSAGISWTLSNPLDKNSTLINHNLAPGSTSNYSAGFRTTGRPF